MYEGWVATGQDRWAGNLAGRGNGYNRWDRGRAARPLGGSVGVVKLIRSAFGTMTDASRDRADETKNKSFRRVARSANVWGRDSAETRASRDSEEEMATCGCRGRAVPRRAVRFLGRLLRARAPSRCGASRPPCQRRISRGPSRGASPGTARIVSTRTQAGACCTSRRGPWPCAPPCGGDSVPGARRVRPRHPARSSRCPSCRVGMRAAGRRAVRGFS